MLDIKILTLRFLSYTIIHVPELSSILNFDNFLYHGTAHDLIHVFLCEGAVGLYCVDISKI